jgi:hypothetical protein
MRFYLPRSGNFSRMRGNAYPAQDHAHKESDGPMPHAQPPTLCGQRSITPKLFPTRLLKGEKVKKLHSRNKMAIASGLIASKVPALRNERASIGSLEPEAT